MLNLEEKDNVPNSKKNTAAGKLLSIESIFKWKPVIYEENLQEITCEFEPQALNQFNFYNFVIRLIKCYTICDDTKTNDESALKLLDELILAANQFNEDGDGGFFRKIENAYFHMVYASKTFLLIRNDKHEEAAEIIEKIKPIDDMDDCNKAAIHGMKSAVFALFSTEDSQKAFACIDKAQKLDERGLWYFLKGLYIRRIRRMTNPFESPSLQEKEQFEKAFEKEPSNVVFKLHLADVYREITKHASQRSDLCSHFLPKDNTLNDILKSNIDEKFHLAAQYYKEAAKEFPDCPYVMFRAADGLAKLPDGLNDVKMARKLTKDGLKLSPESVCGNLVQAFICEKFDKNMKDARKHLKICTEKSIFEADMNMIRILYSAKPNELNGIDVLTTLMEKYKEKTRNAILYSQKVSYYLFIEDDVVKANENATHFYELNTGSTCMKIHRSCFVPTPEPFSLIYVLIDQVKLVLDRGGNSEALENSCKKFLHFINFQNIPPLPGFPRNFRQQILDGKPVIINENFLKNPFKKFDQMNKASNKRENTNKKGNFGKERVPQSNNSRPNTSNKANSGNKRKPNESDQVPSLMDINIPKPVDKNVRKRSENTPTENVVEKHVEKRSEENDDPTSDDSTEMTEILKKLIKQMKKKKSQPEGKSKSKNDDEESIVELLKCMGIGGEKNTRGKKHRSDSHSETDSDYKRRKDRRRDRSRRRHRSRSDSDDSERYSRRHRRHKHHSSDSEDSSRSLRRKSHKKDRHERDYSPRSRHHRRRHHSSDDDVDYTSKSTYRRDDSRSPERRRRHRRDSRDRSQSYEKRRRSSPKKYKKSSRQRSTSPDEPRRGREGSVASRTSRNKSPSYDKHSRRRSPNKERSDHHERKVSSEREIIDKTSHEKKSRRRSTSRDKPQSRGSKSTKSKKEGESSKNASKRDQNSSRRSSEESDS